MKKKLIVYALSIPLLTNAQSNSQNYVKETHYLNTGGANITNVNYYNGLGYLVETASTSSGTADGVYTFRTYDSKGLESKTYYPVPIGGGLDFRSRQTFCNSSTDFYDDDSAFRQNHYDADGRIIREDIAGKDWHTHGAHNGWTYGTNTDGDRVIKYSELNLKTGHGYYPAGCLEKTSAKDADGNEIITFRDLDGNTILERRNQGDTYFVYNRLGQLRYILPPKYQESRDLAAYAYQYEYDNRGNLVRKTLPGIQCSQYWYDKEGRLVIDQDALLRSRGLYRFRLYDRYGRMAVTGTCTHCRTDMRYAEVKVCYTPSGGFLNTGYSFYSSSMSDLISAAGATVEKVYYYDRYDFLAGPYKSDFNTIGPVHEDRANGLLTGSVIRASNGQMIFTVNCYDIKGNLTGTRTKWLDGYVSSVTNTYSLTNKLEMWAAEVDVRYGNKFKVTLDHDYSIRNNLLSRKTVSLSHGGDICTSSIGYDYDATNRLSRIIRSDYVGNVSYGYEIHGWPVSIETKSFKEYLAYADGVGTPCYNGNISTVKWSNGNGTQPKGYRFRYDSLNRLTSAAYGEGETLNDATGRYDERVNYDLNGNITRLERHGRKQDGNYGIIDKLDVSLAGNRIANITDDAEMIVREGVMDFNPAANGRTTYTYNDSGALTSDTGRGITMIEYDNCMNPARIQFANGNITKYIYSADGQKLRTIYYTAMSNIKVETGQTHELTVAEMQAADSVDYLMGGKLLMRNGRIDKYIFEGGYCEAYKPVTCVAKPFIPIMDDDFPTSEEEIEELTKAWREAQEKYNNMDNFYFRYYNKDHLGNNREVVDAGGSVMQVTDYYPFGTPYSDRPATTNAGLQPFKYNGKELDHMHGLNTYDYGARQYDPITGRWDRMDPLCEKYYSVSPYAYCHNNPVNFIDPNGKEIRIHYMQDKKEESFVYSCGMTCPTNNAFATTCVSVLNALSKNELASPVLAAVIKSSNMYDFKNIESEGGPKTMQFKPNAKQNGAVIHAALFMDNAYSLDDKIGSAGHEIYHGFEQIEGNNPATVNGEVDAYLFGYMIRGAGKLGNSTAKGRIYNKAMDEMSLGNKLQDNYTKALNSFSEGAKANNSGLYNQHKIEPEYRTSILKQIEEYYKCR